MLPNTRVDGENAADTRRLTGTFKSWAQQADGPFMGGPNDMKQNATADSRVDEVQTLVTGAR